MNLTVRTRSNVATPRVSTSRFPSILGTLALLSATYWGSACARPQYVADHHAALQSPVTLGEGNTGKPALHAPSEGGQAAQPAQPPTPELPPSLALSPAPNTEPRSGIPGASQPSGAEPTAPARTPREPAATGEPAGDSAPFDPRKTPDPELAPTSAYYELTLRYCEAGVHLVGARRVVLERPSTLPRLMGRFAAELWIGHELLERDRFDFPLVAADAVEPGSERKEPPPLQLGPRADVVWKVKVADRVRATQAWVIDRATGERWLLDWPPKAPMPKPRADAPCPSFGGK